MLASLAKLLRKIATWLNPPYEVELWNRAVGLINAAESFNSSGEYKRHKVYSQLKKEFSTLRSKDISFLIEVIIQERN